MLKNRKLLKIREREREREGEREIIENKTNSRHFSCCLSSTNSNWPHRVIWSTMIVCKLLMEIEKLCEIEIDKEKQNEGKRVGKFYYKNGNKIF